MTNQEKQEIKKKQEAVKKWNIAQSKAYDKAQKEYFALRSKYAKLNGSASCEYSSFIIEVATCGKTTQAEKTRDLYTVIKYHEACGRWEALSEYITG